MGKMRHRFPGDLHGRMGPISDGFLVYSYLYLYVFTYIPIIIIGISNDSCIGKIYMNRPVDPMGMFFLMILFVLEALSLTTGI